MLRVRNPNFQATTAADRNALSAFVAGQGTEFVTFDAIRAAVPSLAGKDDAQLQLIAIEAGLGVET